MRFKELNKQKKFLFRYRVTLLSSMVFIIAVVVGAVFTRSFTSSFFMTPIEIIVGKSNNQLKDNYQKMKQEYALLDSVLRNIKERDEVIYNQLFGADISDMHRYEDETRARDKRREELEKLSFAKLVTMLIKESDKLNCNVSDVSAKLKESRDVVSRRALNFRSIPSMQPINNSDLSKSITPSGMRINPFVKSFSFHKGIDYSIPEETRIFATADGKVQTVMTSNNQGGTIIINHGNHYTTVYGNLSKTIVSTGQRVKRGAIIGYSGNTGTSFLPHLHYEVKYKNKNLDPFDFFFGELSLHQIEKLKIESAQNIQSFD